MPSERAPLPIVVTGGAGFIGSHVAEALVGAGHRVLVIDDLSSGKRENVPDRAELLVADIRSEEARAVMAEGGFEVLVHHAAQMDVRRSTEDPMYDASVNILGTLGLVKAGLSMRGERGGLKQVIFASTGGAIYGEQDHFPATENHPTRPLSPYGVSKLAGERYLYYFHAEYGLDVTCLRYANVYGPRQSPHGEAGVVAIFTSKLLAGEAPTINGDGRQTRDYVYVGDVVRANLAVLGEPGFRTWNVGTGVETDVVELFDELRVLTRSDFHACHGPGKPGEQRRSVIDGSPLRRKAELPEPVGLATGLGETVEWFRRQAS